MPRYQQSPDVVAKRLGDEFVVVHLQTNRIYSLNRTGGRLWELVVAGHDREEIERRMLAEFDVEGDQLSREIDGILASLQADQLIREQE